MNKEALITTSKLLKLNFDTFLSNYDFLFLSEKLEKYYIEYIYIKGDLYIKFEINLYPQDFPYYFRIILGEGSLDFPESDWNSTALWRIGQLNNPSSQAGYYTIEDIDDVKTLLKRALDDFERVGKEFLCGNLETFIAARKNQNINREPYKMYSKDKNKKIQIEYDSNIIELKSKYS